MLSRTSVVYIFFIFIFVIILYFLNKRCSLEIKNISSKYSKSLETLTNQYQRDLDSYKEKIKLLQQNNIIITKTIYLPSGEKIVSRKVDKSTRTYTGKKEYASVSVKDTQNNVKFDDFLTFSDSTQKPSLDNYFVSVSYSFNREYTVGGGIRLFSLPFFATVSVPVTSKFYLNPQIGVNFTF